jgi:hypothetical protein
MAPDRESGAMVRKGTAVCMVFSSPPFSSPELIWLDKSMVEKSNDPAINAMNPDLNPFAISLVLIFKYNMFSAKRRYHPHFLSTKETAL